jgi:hypothetical protein
MKKCLMGLLVAVLFVAPAFGAAVYLNPSTQTIGNSVVTTVELVVSTIVAPGVDTLNLVLRFDETLVNVTGVAQGAFMAGAGEMIIPFGPKMDNVNGEISYTLWNLGANGASGSGTAVVMTFVSDAANTGTSPLEYTSWLLEPTTGTKIAATESTGDVIVVGGGGPVVPEPATLMLVAAGLAALGGYAKRKRS